MKYLKSLSLTLLLLSASLTFAQQSPIPCSNPANPPGETCCLATPICDFNGYCGRTLTSYSPDAWEELKLAIKAQTLTLGGIDWLTIENDSYLKFIASSTTISFNVYVYDCLGIFGTKAIQVAFFSADNCSSGPVNVVYTNAQMNQQAAPHSVTVNNLIPGKVYYILIDGYSSKNCGYTFEAVAGVELPQVAIDIAPTATVCSGGSVTANVTGGTGNNYSWTGAAGLSATTGATVTITPPTTPGTYAYTAEASGGSAWCPSNSSDVLTITVPSPITFSNVNVGACVSNAYSVSGTLQTTQTPTSGNLIIEDCNGNQTVVASAPFNGTSFPFNLTGLDANGSNCILTAYFSVTNCPATNNFTAPAPCSGCNNVTITYTSDITNASCGNSDGKITLTGSGGASPYTYSIDNGNTFQNSGTFTNLATGSYNVIVKDNNGCSTSGTENIGNADGPSITNTTSNNPSCFGLCDGSIQVTVTGGAQPYVYKWFDNLGNPIGTNSNSITDLCDGTYSVQVKDDNDCITTGNITLTQPTSLNANFSGINPNYCNSDPTVNLIPIQIGGTFSGPGVNGNTFNPKLAGNGTHVITYTIGNSANCTETHTVTVIVSGPTANFTADPMITDMSNTEVNFDNLSVGATNYTWNFGDNSISSNDNDPSHIFPNDGPNQYTVSLTVTDNFGCTSTKSVIITITALEMEYGIPNIFTPNDDKSNDYFHLIKTQNVVGLDVIILNRWGNMVFESNEVNFMWNGQTNNQGSECAEGTYFYKMELKNMNGEIKTEHGFVQLSRGN